MSDELVPEGLSADVVAVSDIPKPVPVVDE